jgi:hypothetical protein
MMKRDDCDDFIWFDELGYWHCPRCYDGMADNCPRGTPRAREGEAPAPG